MFPGRGLALESLEDRQLLAAVPMITEFMASNDGTLRDGDGKTPDWIEVYNPGDSAVDLFGYALTDKPDDPFRWVFPSIQIGPGGILVVFASGRDVSNYVDAGGSLHTNFSLRANGEYLALTAPDATILSEFGTRQETYPPQRTDVSYGAAQQKTLIDRQSESHYLVPTNAEVDATWTQPGFDAPRHGFSAGRAALGYESESDLFDRFGGEIVTTLPSQTHGVYARVEFDVVDVSEVTELTLRMKYDHGFVAYLNGEKVVAVNAPREPHWFSMAIEPARRDGLAVEFEDFDLTEHVSKLAEGTNVLAIHGLNGNSDLDDFLMVPRLLASMTGPLDIAGYMTSPTPGSLNVADSDVFSGFVAEAQTSVGRGIYESPFDVTVETQTPGAVVRYTTDSRIPTATTGSVYTGPIRVDTTTTLRAAAFLDGHIPSAVETHTYVFLDDVITQPADPLGFPSLWRVPADYAMDANIVNDAAYRDEIIEGLRSIRTMSIVMDPGDLFGPSGIYSNTTSRGEDWVRPASVEIISADGRAVFQTTSGIRIHGNSTRSSSTKKHSFRLTFRDEFGAAKLDYPLFPDAGVERFDDIVLRAGLMHVDPQLIRETFARDTARDMGKVEGHAAFVHLYLNGLYWGLYNPFERPDAQFAEEYFGGSDEDYDSLASGRAIDGDVQRYDELIRLINSGFASPKAFAEFEQQVDLDNLIDFLLINQYMASAENEWRAVNRRDGDAKFRFFLWDMDERSLRGVDDANNTAAYLPGGVYDRLRENSEFRIRYADRAHKHLFHGGALTPHVAAARWEQRAEEIHAAIIAESARWGDVYRSEPYTRDVEWQADRDRLLREYFPARTQVVIDQLRASGLYPRLDAPAFSRHGGLVPDGFGLTMTQPDPSGTILFTTDGTDPRLPGGNIAARALVFDTSPIAITEDTVVRSRVFADGEWSAMNEARFFVTAPDSPLHLRVSEVNYHPHAANPVPGLGEASVGNEEFEYIELVNTSDQTIDIGGVQVTRGVRFSFSEATYLVPGERILVVKNRAAFESRYGPGLNIAGQFNGNLANTVGVLELREATGRLIQNFTYDSQQASAVRTNGAGSTLEVIDPLDAGTDLANARSSGEFGGSPGAAGLGPDDRVAITEILANAAWPLPDMIELKNATNGEIDIGTWYISNSREDYFKSKIPAGTAISSGDYQVITEHELGFGLSDSEGDNLWLIEADVEGRPLRFVDHAEFGPSQGGTSLGPSPNSDGTWLPLSQPTFGRRNSGVAVGDVVISEIHYAPIDPDGSRGPLGTDDVEYVELYNRTDSTVDLTSWRLTGGVDVVLPPDALIGPYQTVVIVSFDPAESPKSAAFRALYRLDSSAALFGPYAGDLDDNTDVVRLERPDWAAHPGLATRPYLFVDEVSYKNAAPWPMLGAASRRSLTRVEPTRFGNHAASWTPRVATPGSIDFIVSEPGDANDDGRFDESDITQVLVAGKYMTDEPAFWEEGDFNGDHVFDQLDIVAALQTGELRR